MCAGQGTGVTIDYLDCHVGYCIKEGRMHLYNLNVSLAIPLGSAFQRTLRALGDPGGQALIFAIPA